MRYPTILAALLAIALPATAQAAPVWAGAWGYAPADMPAQYATAMPPGTYRYRVRLTQAGDALQLTFSNAEGDVPLAIASASVASPSGPAGTEPAANSVRPLVFSGRSGVALPAGHAVISDPLVVPVAYGQDLIVSVTFSTPTRSGGTSVAMEMAFAPEGAGKPFAPIQTRAYLSLVSVRAPVAPCTVVAFGDSITDGVMSTSLQTRGWPGRLAERLGALSPARRCGVVNMGISGNRVLRPGRATSALDRFARDVASVPNVTSVIFLEGINDIGNSAATGADVVSADSLIHGYRQFVARAHALGIKVIGATITPALHAGYMSPAKEQVRAAVNTAIRTGKIFDSVVDFDAAVRNPAAPSDLRPEFDPGDHLHPNDAGLRAMGDAVNLAALAPGR
jgi:lysophospholipase L1-like esterase